MNMRGLQLIVLSLFFLTFWPRFADGQIFKRKENTEEKDEKDEKDKENKDRLKLYQNTQGILIGYEKGRSDMLNVGYHYNWKKIRLKKPTIHAVEGIASVNPFDGILGIQGSYWQRIGRFKWTYGGRIGAFTDFSESTLSVGPVVGFRILGIHGQTGVNLLSNSEVNANILYLNLSLLIGTNTRIHSQKGDKKKDILKW